jgi:hypothetical protein
MGSAARSPDPGGTSRGLPSRLLGKDGPLSWASSPGLSVQAVPSIGPILCSKVTMDPFQGNFLQARRPGRTLVMDSATRLTGSGEDLPRSPSPSMSFMTVLCHESHRHISQRGQPPPMNSTTWLTGSGGNLTSSPSPGSPAQAETLHRPIRQALRLSGDLTSPHTPGSPAQRRPYIAPYARLTGSGGNITSPPSPGSPAQRRPYIAPFGRHLNSGPET